MREVLRGRRLVCEHPTGGENSQNFAERALRTGLSSAHVIARTEVDHEIEAPVVEGHAANIAVHNGGIRPAHGNACPGNSGEFGIDIDRRKRDRSKPLGEHGKRNSAPAPHFEDTHAARESQRAAENWHLDERLQVVAGTHVAKRLVLFGRFGRGEGVYGGRHTLNATSAAKSAHGIPPAR